MQRYFCFLHAFVLYLALVLFMRRTVRQLVHKAVGVVVLLAAVAIVLAMMRGPDTASASAPTGVGGWLGHLLAPKLIGAYGVSGSAILIGVLLLVSFLMATDWMLYSGAKRLLDRWAEPGRGTAIEDGDEAEDGVEEEDEEAEEEGAAEASEVATSPRKKRRKKRRAKPAAAGADETRSAKAMASESDEDGAANERKPPKPKPLFIRTHAFRAAERRKAQQKARAAAKKRAPDRAARFLSDTFKARSALSEIVPTSEACPSSGASPDKCDAPIRPSLSAMTKIAIESNAAINNEKIALKFIILIPLKRANLPLLIAAGIGATQNRDERPRRKGAVADRI